MKDSGAFKHVAPLNRRNVLLGGNRLGSVVVAVLPTTGGGASVT
jgi:hypothetical protein